MIHRETNHLNRELGSLHYIYKTNIRQVEGEIKDTHTKEFLYVVKETAMPSITPPKWRSSTIYLHEPSCRCMEYWEYLLWFKKMKMWKQVIMIQKVKTASLHFSHMDKVIPRTLDITRKYPWQRDSKVSWKSSYILHHWVANPMVITSQTNVYLYHNLVDVSLIIEELWASQGCQPQFWTLDEFILNKH